ncbi:DUF7695 domain-containing protein [Fusibacter sp. JL216-2]|uniref:DUF7695 domain-containing protein n=1 Tax=Fusibacter sp. JL216-2 TaxID=3071453 RepID=UPI003D342C44
MKIVKNRARCRVCNKIIESLSKNDGMKYCSCGAIAVYGGKEAIMRLGHHRDIEDMSIKVFEAEHPVYNPDGQLHIQD